MQSEPIPVVTVVTAPPEQQQPLLFEVPAPLSNPPPRPAPAVSLKTPASIIVRKDQRNKTGGKKNKSVHVLSRLDLTPQMMAVNQVISGIHLVDSLGRPANPQLGFQLQGTHWVLEFDSEVQRFAEEDIYLTIFDVLYNSGFELIQQYDQEIHSSKGMGETVLRESFLFQRLRAIPVFNA